MGYKTDDLVSDGVVGTTFVSLVNLEPVIEKQGTLVTFKSATASTANGQIYK